MISAQQLIPALCLLASTSALSQGMTPISDEGLAAIDAQEGIALNVDFVVNAYLDKDTGIATPIACPAGVPDCRLALEFNDMDGAWLILKDYYGAFSLNSVWMDANTTQSSASGLCDSDCQARFPGGFNANNRQVVQFSYDHSDIGLGAAFYGDGDLFYEIGRITAEFGSNGYLTDNVTGSTLGVRISDSSDPGNAAAQIRFDGRMQLYGF